jgi:hypothetical protein
MKTRMAEVRSISLRKMDPLCVRSYSENNPNKPLTASIVLAITPQWDNGADDDVVQSALTRFLDDCTEVAKEMGAYHPFVYLNYAHESQDPFGSYGEKNRKKLRDIQKKYDTLDVFSRLQPGYFRV